jgi:hypothetical protein
MKFRAQIPESYREQGLEFKNSRSKDKGAGAWTPGSGGVETGSWNPWSWVARGWRLLGFRWRKSLRIRPLVLVGRRKVLRAQIPVVGCGGRGGG